MAKVKNPLFSLGASGTVAGLLTVNQSLTAPTARRKPSGYRPPTPAQSFMRDEMRACSQAWATLSSQVQAEWAALVNGRAQTPFGKYWLEWRAQGATLATPPYIPMA